jgi:uncharacterized protein (DUF1810 family)/protein-tyrosine-phosphatase
VTDHKPSILFLCTHNAGRSQMAAAFARQLGAGRVVVHSAGSDPGERLNPAVVSAMSEKGLDISNEAPKRLTDEMGRTADVIVTMGCGDECPVYLGKRYVDWDLTDPAGRPLEEVRPIRDEIESRVEDLIAELLVSLTGDQSGPTMDDPYDLERFVSAQGAHGIYEHAVGELRAGRKASHWMWFVFPQIVGLGQSEVSRTFAVSSVDEAGAYLRHPVLGPRLLECASILAEGSGSSAERIFGSVDAKKLRSSMTLFMRAAPHETVFAQVLNRYFDGLADVATDERI